MSDLFQRWLSLALLWRMASTALLGLGLLMLTWLLLLRPQQREHEAQLSQLAEMKRQQQQRQQLFASRPAIAALEAEIDRLQQSDTSGMKRVSLEKLLATRGNLLDAWHADSQPQQLTLQLSWPEFVPLFAELASTTLPVPQRFQLQAEQGRLNTQLWLEAENAE